MRLERRPARFLLGVLALGIGMSAVTGATSITPRPRRTVATRGARNCPKETAAMPCRRRRPASRAGRRSAGFNESIGPGAEGHDDHTHLTTRSGQYWSAPDCM